MSETLTGESNQPQDPDPLKSKAPRKPRASVGEAAPPRAADEKSRAAEHKRKIEKGKTDHDHAVSLQILVHDQEMAKKAARHKQWMEWAMLGLGGLACGACVGIGIAPRLSDDLKKTIIGVLALFLSNVLSFRVGKASADK